MNNEDKEKENRERQALLHKALEIEQSNVLSEVADELTKLAYPESFKHLLHHLLNRSIDTEFIESIKKFAELVPMQDPCYEILDFLRLPGTNHLQVPLLSWCWEFAWDCSNHLPELCDLAGRSDIESCIEILTIADNMKSIPPQQDIVKSLIMLKNAMHGPDENKNSLLAALMETINNY